MNEQIAFSVEEIPEFFGPGPVGNYLPLYAARQELWQYSLSAIQDPNRNWCEFGVAEGESLDWFTSRKPRANKLFAFDSFDGIPEPWLVYPAGHWKSQVYKSNRLDVVVVPGRFETSLTPQVVRDVGTIGLLHIDCDLYSSTKAVFEGIGAFIQRGTVIIFDELYNYFGWEDHEFKAWLEFVIAHRIEFEYLGRTATCQVSVRVTRRGRSARSTVCPCTWSPIGQGIGVRISSP